MQGWWKLSGAGDADSEKSDCFQHVGIATLLHPHLPDFEVENKKIEKQSEAELSPHAQLRGQGSIWGDCRDSTPLHRKQLWGVLDDGTISHHQLQDTQSNCLECPHGGTCLVCGLAISTCTAHIAKQAPTGTGEEKRWKQSFKTQAIPRETGNVVTQLQMLVKDLHTTSLPCHQDVIRWGEASPIETGMVMNRKQVSCSEDAQLFLKNSARAAKSFFQ